MSFSHIKLFLVTLVYGSISSNSVKNVHLHVKPASAIKHVAVKVNVRFSYIQSTAVDVADVMM